MGGQPHPSILDGEGYTKEEQQFLEEGWGSEWKFLQSHGLTVNNDEDREKGRVLARELIVRQSEDVEVHYTKEEKEFLNEKFGSVFKFLLKYELSVHEVESREKGRRIARKLFKWSVANGKTVKPKEGGTMKADDKHNGA
jgi:hypothetical protein